MDPRARYHYTQGYNPAAIWATAVAALAPCRCVFVPGLKGLDDYSWFIGCGIGFAVYSLIAPRMGISARVLDAKNCVK